MMPSTGRLAAQAHRCGPDKLLLPKWRHAVTDYWRPATVYGGVVVAVLAIGAALVVWR